MPSQVLSRRKWKLHANDQHIIVVKGTREKFTHPLMKALLWALYMPDYPNISIEIRIGDKYKPDVVAFEDDAELRPVANSSAHVLETHSISEPSAPSQIVTLKKQLPAKIFKSQQ